MCYCNMWNCNSFYDHEELYHWSFAANMTMKRPLSRHKELDDKPMRAPHPVYQVVISSMTPPFYFVKPLYTQILPKLLDLPICDL